VIGPNARLRRERGLGGIVGDSLNLFFEHFGAFVAMVFPAAITSLAFSLLPIAFNNDTAAAVIFLISLPVDFIVFELVTSAGVVYLDQIDQQDRIPTAESLDRAQHRIGIVLGASIRATLITVALAITIVGIPFAIMRVVRWSFLSQVVMLDDKTGEEVLATSARLVEGYWWSTFGRLIVTSLVVGVPSVIVSGIAAAAAPAIVAAFVDAAFSFVTVPYGIITTTLIYYHLKTRKQVIPRYPNAGGATP
jgi:hypothetical protein